MLVIRILAFLALIAIGGSLLAWMITGNPKYRMWAWYAFLSALLLLLAFLGTLAVERVVGPIG